MPFKLSKILYILILLNSACALDISLTGLKVDKGTTPPQGEAPVSPDEHIVLSVAPSNKIPGFENQPRILATGTEAGDTVKIYIDENCQDPLGQGIADGTSIDIQSSTIPAGFSQFRYSLETGGNSEVVCSETTLSYGTWPMNSSEVVFSDSVADDSAEFVGMDVSLDKNLALLAIGSGPDCLSAIDISDLSAPKLFHTIGSSSTPAVNGDTCRAVQFLGASDSFLLPNFRKHTEVWSLGTDAKMTSSWFRQEDLFTSTKQARRMDRFFDKGGHYSFLMASVGGLLKMQMDKDTKNITITNSGTDAYDTTDSLVYQDGVLVADDIIVATEAGTGKPIKVFDASSTLVKTIPLDNADSYMWSASTSVNQTEIAISGKLLALLSYDPEVTTPADRVQLQSETPLNASMRDMEFLDYDGHQYLIGAFSDGSVQVYNTDDLSSPVRLKNFELPNFISEAYGIKVFPEKHLVFVVGRKGRFAVLNLYQLLQKATDVLSE